MKRQGLPVSIVAAILIGLGQTYLISWCMAVIAAYVPLPQWLIDQGITGATQRAVLFTTDFGACVLLCLPAALLLCKLRPAKPWAYVALAVIPGFIWQYRLVLGDGALLRHWALFLPGAFAALFMLPVAAFVVRRGTSRGAPDKSFKPTAGN